MYTHNNAIDEYFISKAKKKARIRSDTIKYPHFTRDPIWESDKNSRRHYTQEIQEVSRFPAGDHKAARKRQDAKTIPKKELRLGTVCNKQLEGLNMFKGANLTLKSDVDQDTYMLGYTIQDIKRR